MLRIFQRRNLIQRHLFFTRNSNTFFPLLNNSPQIGGLLLSPGNEAHPIKGEDIPDSKILHSPINTQPLLVEIIVNYILNLVQQAAVDTQTKRSTF